VEVRIGGLVVARTTAAVRVLETASPPTYYLPPDDVDQARIAPAPGSSWCEWKGRAAYWDVIGEGPGAARAAGAAWSYPHPTQAFEAIAGYLSFYPARLTCTVDGEVVQPQEGGFYGGWVTADITGPWKGAPGTQWW
jgi:uncharacterized protein (DUF427 family)